MRKSARCAKRFGMVVNMDIRDLVLDWIHERVEDVEDLMSRFADPLAQPAMAYVEQSLMAELANQ
jgi:hypothetical protein